MLYSSLLFIFGFLPIALAVYYISPKYLKNLILLILSLLFYSFGEPVYIAVMMVLIVVVYFLALFIRKFNKLGKINQARGTLIGGIIMCILVLCGFKYLSFLVSSINILMPIGMSLYIFNILSYLIDVYRKDGKAQENIFELALYIIMFPKIIWGPMVKYKDMAIQINYRDETIEKFAEGIRKFVIGLGKTVVFAGFMKHAYNHINYTYQGDMAVGLLWISATAYTLYLYFGFSGCSDMAIGLGKMFSFDFGENFNYPFVSKSILEFVRRWNVSVTAWFKDYIYDSITKGKNKKGIVALATVVTMVFLVLWYRADFKILVAGGIFILLCLNEKLWLGKILDKIPRCIGGIYTFILVNSIFTIVSADSIVDGFRTIRDMFFAGGLSLWNGEVTYVVLGYGVVMVIMLIATLPHPAIFTKAFLNAASKNSETMKKVRCVIEPAFVVGVLIVAMYFLANGEVMPFEYFRF